MNGSDQTPADRSESDFPNRRLPKATLKAIAVIPCMVMGSYTQYAHHHLIYCLTISLRIW